MNSKWILFALLFSVAVNIAVVGTLIYFWPRNEERHMIVRQAPPQKPEIIWFGTPHVPPHVAQEIDSLRRDYHKNLVRIRAAMDADRKTLITQLIQDPVDRDSLDLIIDSLAQKQIKAERLTVDHLLDIKPLLPHEEWTFFMRDLEPQKTIRTKIIKLNGGDSTSILMQEEIEVIERLEQKAKNINKQIPRKTKNERNRP